MDDQTEELMAAIDASECVDDVFVAFGPPRGVDIDTVFAELPETSIVCWIVELNALKKRLKDDEAAMKQAYRVLEAELLRRWRDEGKNQERRGKTTISLRCERWPKNKRGADEVVAACQSDEDTKHLAKMTVNTQSLRSFMLDDENCPPDDEGIPQWPEHMREALDVSERWTIRVTGK